MLRREFLPVLRRLSSHTPLRKEADPNRTSNPRPRENRLKFKPTRPRGTVSVAQCASLVMEQKKSATSAKAVGLGSIFCRQQIRYGNSSYCEDECNDNQEFHHGEACYASFRRNPHLLRMYRSLHRGRKGTRNASASFQSGHFQSTLGPLPCKRSLPYEYHYPAPGTGKGN